MATHSKRSLIWPILWRSVLPALFLFLWVASIFQELHLSRRWSEGISYGFSSFNPSLPMSGTHGGTWSVCTLGGAIHLVWYRTEEGRGYFRPPDPLTVHWNFGWGTTYVVDAGRVRRSILGLGRSPLITLLSSTRVSDRHNLFPIPWILPTGIAMIPLLRLLWSHRRSVRRQAAGLCLQCAYDLRAHRPGDRCPECGTLILPPAGNIPYDKVVPEAI